MRRKRNGLFSIGGFPLVRDGNTVKIGRESSKSMFYGCYIKGFYYRTPSLSKLRRQVIEHGWLEGSAYRFPVRPLLAKNSRDEVRTMEPPFPFDRFSARQISWCDRACSSCQKHRSPATRTRIAIPMGRPRQRVGEISFPVCRAPGLKLPLRHTAAGNLFKKSMWPPLPASRRRCLLPAFKRNVFRCEETGKPSLQGHCELIRQHRA